MMKHIKTELVVAILGKNHLKLWMGFVRIAEELQQMENVFAVVAILGVLAKRVVLALVICLAERTPDANQENR